MGKRLDAVDKLEKWMSARDLTQLDVATRTESTQGTVSRYLARQRTPPMDWMMAAEKMTSGEVSLPDWALLVRRAKAT